MRCFKNPLIFVPAKLIIVGKLPSSPKADHFQDHEAQRCKKEQKSIKVDIGSYMQLLRVREAVQMCNNCDKCINIQP